MKDERLTAIIHFLSGIIVGYVSSTLTVNASFLLSIFSLFALAYITDSITGRRGIKWWVGNGAVIYIFTWFTTWIYILNR